MYTIALVNEAGDVDRYAAGDPTPGRGCNEFASVEAAEQAIAELDQPEDGERWEVLEQ